MGIARSQSDLNRFRFELRDWFNLVRPVFFRFPFLNRCIIVPSIRALSHIGPLAEPEEDPGKENSCRYHE